MLVLVSAGNLMSARSATWVSTSVSAARARAWASLRASAFLAVGLASFFQMSARMLRLAILRLNGKISASRTRALWASILAVAMMVSGSPLVGGPQRAGWAMRRL